LGVTLPSTFFKRKRGSELYFLGAFLEFWHPNRSVFFTFPPRHPGTEAKSNKEPVYRGKFVVSSLIERSLTIRGMRLRCPRFLHRCRPAVLPLPQYQTNIPSASLSNLACIYARVCALHKLAILKLSIDYSEGRAVRDAVRRKKTSLCARGPLRSAMAPAPAGASKGRFCNEFRR